MLRSLYMNVTDGAHLVLYKTLPSSVRIYKMDYINKTFPRWFIPFQYMNSCFDICFEEHRHESFELIQILNGEMELTINDIDYSGKKGDIFILNPFERHSGKLNAKITTLLEYKVFMFSPELLDIKNSATYLELSEKFITAKKTVTNFIPTTDICNKIITEHLQFVPINYDTNALETGLYFFAQIYSIMSCLYQYDKVINSKTSSCSTKSRIFISTTLTFVNAHYAEQITSKDVAQYLFYNESYFCRVFKKHFKTTFSDFLQKFRIKKLKKLRLEDFSSISDLAISVGFNDYNSFYQLFKKQTGLTPSKFFKFKY